jgi:predicted glycoside hydrolase/deacetylase ChbG (UPF0249 family)
VGATHGLLIVNADDFGLRPDITDAIIEVYRAARITSATAMVYMWDGARAAALAQEYGLPLGLHLNLTVDFRDPAAPSGARERQTRIVRYFAGRGARHAYDPRVRRLVADCFRDQVEAFAATYGGEPTHFDGHQHIHVCPTVALSVPLAAIPRARAAHTYGRDERGPAKRLVRAAQNALLRHRFRIPAAFLDFDDVHPELGGSGLDRLAIARHAPVEIMTHPRRPGERPALLGGAWGEALAAYRTGTYLDL